MQTKLTPGKLLDKLGNLNEAGYSTSLIRDYNRDDIKAGKLRIKEWDYYYIGNDKFGIALTIDDNSYMKLGSVSVLEFDTKYWVTKSAMGFMSLGKTNLPPSSKVGSVSQNYKKLKLEFINDGNTRHLLAYMKKFDGNQDFSCDIRLYDEPADSMVIATPFDKPKYFYYNQKINCMKVAGTAKVGDKEYNFDKNESYAVLDWGRGVWTYKNTWYWSSLSCSVDGQKVGFNLGYGFGNTSAASENMIFYNGKAYKVDQVEFNIPVNEKGKDDYLASWTIKSNDGKVDLEFFPILDRHDDTNLLILKSLQHQVFGHFRGRLLADDKVIELNDKVGFAEKVTNYW